MRPRALSDGAMRAAMRSLRASGRPVTAAAFAAETGMSQRSAFRYFERFDAGIRTCRTCHGHGTIRVLRKDDRDADS